jgi:hypothetical protein
MRHHTVASLLLAAQALCAGLLADEVRLRDGRVLYGKVTQEKDALAIETRDGTVRVASADVAARTTDAQLLESVRELAKSQQDTPFARLQLALQCHAYALESEMWRHLDALMAAPADDRARFEKRIGDFLRQLEPELLPRKYRIATTDVRVRELLHRHREKDGQGKRAARIALLVHEANADKDLRVEARKNRDADRRALAVEALVRRGTAGNDSFAWRTSILDRDAGVRATTIAACREAGAAAGAARYLAPGLGHGSADIRVRTAEAFAALGDKDARSLLVLAAPNAGAGLAGGGTAGENRAHVAFLDQQAYVRDFDVEVASASLIADPKVDMLQSGSVLDVSVHGIVEERVRILKAYRTALGKLGGSDPGPDVAAWPAWLRAQEEADAKPAPTTPGSAPAPAPASPSSNGDAKR